jgi:hypothetical protein
MSAWVWVLIAVAAAFVLAGVVWRALERKRTDRLRGQFGPEYDRTVSTAESKHAAETELTAREERRSQLEIRPLTSAARERYLERWQVLQSQFVDEPRTAVAGADSLILSVMSDRGYPVDDFEQQAADVSVDHPQVVEHYREGHRLAHADERNGGSTEGLRQAMRHYRALFEELVEPAEDQPLARDPGSEDRVADPNSVRL